MPQPKPHNWVTQNRLPQEFTPVAASSVGAAGASMTVSLGGDLGVTTYLTAVTISCPAVGSVVSGTVTITGVIGAPLNVQFVETVSAGGMWDHDFDPPLPASAAAIAIVVNVPVITGGGAVAVIMYGYEG